VSHRVTALAFAVAAIGLTAAQDVLPGRDWYHGWQYAAILTVAIVAMARYAWRARGGFDGHAGRRVALAMLGAIAVALAGLVSGLVGPDTVTVIGTPGTVTPVPDAGLAAFFSPADPAQLARGIASVTLRRRDAPAIEVGARPVPVGLAVAYTRSHPAGYVVVRDAAGDRLTLTQPNNPAFLSPVLLFRQTQQIHDRSFPLDEFAVPAAHRVVHVLYATPADLAAFGRDAAASGASAAGAILAVSDDAGAQRGIAMAASGSAVAVGDMRVTVTLGTYPVLELASAPQPAVMVGGLLVFLAGCAWALVPAKDRRAAVSTPSYSRS
jgi:hypothetical protein